MEINVWTPLSALVAAAASPLSLFLKNLQNLANGGASPNAQGNAVGLTSTSMNATSPVLKLTRNQMTEDGVFGAMEFSGERICFTIENRALLIPAGQYGLEIYDSPHAGHPVPRLQNVPGKSEIEIHCGNVPQDSKGCIIVGLDHIGDTLERSRDAFALLFPKVQLALQAGPQTIEIIGI